MLIDRFNDIHIIIISDAEVEQEDVAFRKRSTVCTSHGLVFKGEKCQWDKNLVNSKDKIADTIATVSKTSKQKARCLIPARIHDPTSRPYSSIRYNRYESKRGNEENRNTYQSLLVCKTGEKTVPISPSKLYMKKE
jgi:enoyl reductase-like protein